MRMTTGQSIIRQLCLRCYTSLQGAKPVPERPFAALYQTNGQRHDYCTATESVQKPNVASLQGTRLTSRSLILVKGRDASGLLQGLMTNDIQLLDDSIGGQKIIYSMFLNKQGRVLYDVLCYRWSEGQQEQLPAYLLECDTSISPDLQKHLKLYRIRKKVDVTSLDSEYHIWSIFSKESVPPSHSPPSDSYLGTSQIFPDPRIRGLGQRVIIPQGSPVSDVDEVMEEDYRTHRYLWGVAEGVKELPPGDSLPLEANLALMNGVSFTKGCYLGQELTARTHHTGVIRKRIIPIEIVSDVSTVLPSGSTIKSNEGKNIGKLRCHLRRNGLALLRTALIGNQLWISRDEGKDTELVARRPTWWPEEITNK